MATHSGTFAWKIPWTEDLGRQDPWGCEESDMTDKFTFTFTLPEWSSGFPHFLQFKSEFGNKEFMI